MTCHNKLLTLHWMSFNRYLMLKQVLAPILKVVFRLL